MREYSLINLGIYICSTWTRTVEIIFSDGQEGYEYELLGTHNIEKSATAANGAFTLH